MSPRVAGVSFSNLPKFPTRTALKMTVVQSTCASRTSTPCAQQTSALHLYMVRCQAPTMRHQHCHVMRRRTGCGLAAGWGQLVAKRAGWMQAWRKLEGSCRPAAGKLELDTRCRKVCCEQATKRHESCRNDCGKLGARWREAPGSRTMSPGRGSDRTCDAQRSEK